MSPADELPRGLDAPGRGVDLEVWRPCPSHPGYEVSDRGRVRSRRTFAGGREVLHVLQPFVNSRGYYRVRVSGPGRRLVFVHVLVLEAFVGPRPEGKVCAHRNGDPLDNRARNLRWATRSENERDKRAHGTANVGERNPNARLKARDVEEIRERVALEGVSRAELAREFGVSPRCVGSVVRGKTWAA